MLLDAVCDFDLLRVIGDSCHISPRLHHNPQQLVFNTHYCTQVCDFNLSRVMEESAILSSMAASNPRWLAPEILSGRGYTFSSDVFSFGVIMWEFLTWQIPWHDCGPWQVCFLLLSCFRLLAGPTKCIQLTLRQVLKGMLPAVIVKLFVCTYVCEHM